MPRPRRRRRVRGRPEWNVFKPKGVPLSRLREIDLNSDELEALRLKHKEELTQEEAAEEMEVSRSTFSRILKEAHRKITEFLVEGESLRIEDPDYVSYVKNTKQKKKKMR
ncbi:MAG: DUF134 domain-containing protein [Candidatus Aenigmatarchaeota archaeon]